MSHKKSKCDNLVMIEAITRLLFEQIIGKIYEESVFKVFWENMKKMFDHIVGEEQMQELNAWFTEKILREHVKTYLGEQQRKCAETISECNKNVILLCGKAGSGKDFFAAKFIEYCKKKGVHIDEDVHVAAFADQVKLITMMYLEPLFGPLHDKLFGVGTQAEKDKLRLNNNTKSLRDFIKYLANRIFKPTFGDGIWATMVCNNNSKEEFLLITDHRFLVEREVLKKDSKEIYIVEINYKNNNGDNPFTELDETEKNYVVKHNRTPIDKDVKIVYEECESRGFFKSFNREIDVEQSAIRDKVEKDITESLRNQTLSIE